MNNTRHIRVDEVAKTRFDNLRIAKAGMEKRDVTMPELTREMVKTKSFSEVEKELLSNKNPQKMPFGASLILSEFPNKKKRRTNKRGNLADIFIWMIIGFIVVVFFGLWMYGHNIITNVIVGIDGGSSAVNISDAGLKTFGAINNSMPLLQTLSFGIIFAMAISILISNFLVRAHPVFFVVYFLISVVAVVFSVYLSNAYETLLSGSAFSETLVGFSASNIVLSNLPIWTTIISLAGAVFLFIGMIRDDGLGGGVV